MMEPCKVSHMDFVINSLIVLIHEDQWQSFSLLLACSFRILWFLIKENLFF